MWMDCAYLLTVRWTAEARPNRTKTHSEMWILKAPLRLYYLDIRVCSASLQFSSQRLSYFIISGRSQQERHLKRFRIGFYTNVNSFLFSDWYKVCDFDFIFFNTMWNLYYSILLVNLCCSKNRFDCWDCLCLFYYTEYVWSHVRSIRFPGSRWHPAKK